MLKRLAILLLSSVAALLAGWVQAETLKVRLILSDNTPPYQQFSTSLQHAVAASKADVIIVESGVGEKNPNGKPDLIVAVGKGAAEFAISMPEETPILSVLIPQSSYASLLEKYPLRSSSRTVSAIYLDQPWDRQLNFMQVALPKHSIVGVLYSAQTPIFLPRLPHGMSLNARSVQPGEALFDALDSILNSSDVLLAIPDSEIYSSSNVRNILLTSYRYKIPLIGISQAYVNAGALGAIFSTPEQLGEEAAGAIISFMKNRRLPEPMHPTSFSIALNPQVARSLGISLASPEAIRHRMNKAGEGRQ